MSSARVYSSLDVAHTSRPIDATGVPRVAAANAADAFDETADRAVFANGQDAVFAARRMKSALASDDVTQCELIQLHRRDQEVRRKLPEESQQRHDGSLVS